MNSKEAMKIACQKIGVKVVAESLGLSPTAIYNQINDESKNDILQKFVDFVSACEDDTPIQWACEELNGIFVKNPEISVKQKNLMRDCVSNSLKEFQRQRIRKKICTLRLSANSELKITGRRSSALGAFI
jgi:hypothetical protein